MSHDTKTLYLLIVTTIIGTGLLGWILTANLSLFLDTLKFTLLSILIVSFIGFSHLITKNFGVALILLFTYALLTIWAKSTLMVIPLIFISLYFIKFLNINFIFFKENFVLILLSILLILGTNRYTDFMILEHLLDGSIHKDTLFHSSIASMIKNYGTVSTGLNGLIETPYHALSHFLFASFSILLAEPVLKVYGFMPTLLLNPLLIFTVVLVVQKINKKNISIMETWFITIIIFFTIKLLPLEKFALWESYFGSESYTLSLIIFLSAFFILLEKRLNLKKFILITALILLTSLAKASVGMMLLGLLGLRVFLKKIEYTVLYLITISLVYLIIFSMFSSTSNSGGMGIELFNFITDYSLLGESINHIASLPNASWLQYLKAIMSLGLFIVTHFLLSWLVIFSIYKNNEFKKNLFSLKNIYIIGSLFPALLVAFLFKIPGGSAYYFTNITMFIALPFAILFFLQKYPTAYANLSHKKIIFVILLAFIASSNDLKKHSFISSNSGSKDTLATRLLEYKETMPITPTIINQKVTQFPQSNKYRCDIEPFLFVAVTEKPWKNILNTNCDYKHYAYANYFDKYGNILEVKEIKDK